MLASYFKHWTDPRWKMTTFVGLLLLSPIVLGVLPRQLFSQVQLASLRPERPALTRLTAIDRQLELHGSVLARNSGNHVGEIAFTLALPIGAPTIDLDNQPFTINYRDARQRLYDLPWSWRFVGNYDQDELLEDQETIQLTLLLSDRLSHDLGPATAFVIDIVPAHGAALQFSRTTPDQMETTISLN